MNPTELADALDHYAECMTARGRDDLRAASDALRRLGAVEVELRGAISDMQDFARRWREASIEALVERDEEIAALEQKVSELEENVVEALERGKWSL